VVARRPGTEAINLIIQKTRRRLAHGFRTFEHYRLRIVLAADGSRPYRRPPLEAGQQRRILKGRLWSRQGICCITSGLTHSTYKGNHRKVSHNEHCRHT
jgi:hypothetical protein